MASESTGLISLYKCWFGKNLKTNEPKKPKKQKHPTPWNEMGVFNFENTTTWLMTEPKARENSIDENQDHDCLLFFFYGHDKMPWF